MAYAVVNSKFNPFSYDELVKPFNTYSSAYEKQQAVAEALATQAASLEDLSPDLDSTEYQTYSNWKNQLKAVSDELATSGLSPETRERLRNLNLSYNTDLSPVLDKLKTRSELIKEQRTIQAKNPNSVFFDTDYSVTPIGQISSASTYNTYNAEDIMKEVGNDVYSKMNAGEAVPSASEYLTRYAAGLSDKDKIERINNAINSGVSLGTSTYQQKEFDNYIDRVKATRTASGSYSSSYPTSTGSTNIQAYDGHSIIPSYDKKTKQYKIKNIDGKEVVLPDNYTEDDVLKGYYGGAFTYITAFGSQYPAVIKQEKGPSGQSRTVYKIQIGKNWIDAPNGVDTSALDLYNMGQTKANKVHDVSDKVIDSLSGIAPTIRSTVGSDNPDDIDNTKKFKDKKWRKEDMSWREAEQLGVIIPSSISKDMQSLEDSDLGVDFTATVWFDSDNRPIGWKFYKNGGKGLSTSIFKSGMFDN